jgi:uncharacterized protein
LADGARSVKEGWGGTAKVMRVRDMVGRFVALLAALFACGPAALAQPSGASAPRPAIWLLEDADTKIYLFGTTHVFPASLRWRSPALDRVIAQADELVMETPDASAAEMEEAERMFGPMQMGKSIPILERVSPKARPALLAALEATQLPIETYDRLHTWAVAFLLTGFQIAQGVAQEEGTTPDEVALSGAEEQLGAEFRRSKRPISGVETVEEQLGFFASMPQSAQRRFLEMTVMGGDPASPPSDLIGTAWVRGNVDAIASEMAAMPRELYDVLLTRRNRNWTTWLVRRMERPGTVLFAVGAGHLAGPDSVQRMLAARGLQARRID